MKKTLILAMAITLVLTGSLFAANRRLVAEPNATFTPGGAFGTGIAGAGPTSTNNDDTCDIGTAPAATLLLPYFRANTTDINTIFTIVNTSPEAQIAHITVWTDWSFPVLDFNVYLTGYDVQGLSLRDIVFNGVIAPTATPGVAGTTDIGSTTSGTGLSPYGNLSRIPGDPVNPNFAGDAGSAAIGCTSLPGSIGPTLTTAIQNALINGTYVIPGIAESCTSSQRVGSAGGTDPLHPANTAVGYITIDVANKCSLRLPTDTTYFRTDILFDNVLTGDYETFDASAASNYAGGTPLVHIRAIPEGGAAGVLPAGTEAATNLPFTFYSRYQAVGATEDVRFAVFDRRQPLPAQFAARFTQGGGLSTSYNVWREGVTGNTGCGNASSNSALTIAEIVRFDEHENFTTFAGQGGVSPSTPTGSRLNEASRVPVSSAIFPVQPGIAGDVGGWMYLNLDNGTPVQDVIAAAPAQSTNNALYPADAYGVAGRPSQNWVVVSMTGSGAAAGALSVDFDATWLGNGCTPVAGQSPANGGADEIGPAPNVTP